MVRHEIALDRLANEVWRPVGFCSQATFGAALGAVFLVARAWGETAAMLDGFPVRALRTVTFR